MHKLSKTVREAEKVGSNSSIYSDTKKSKNFLNEKKVKITKWTHAFKSYVSTYDVETLNSSNPEIQLKHTESAIKSKLIYLLTESRGFKFEKTLVLLFKKIESEDKAKYNTFCSHSKAETIINESDIDDVFNHCILNLYET